MNWAIRIFCGVLVFPIGLNPDHPLAGQKTAVLGQTIDEPPKGSPNDEKSDQDPAESWLARVEGEAILDSDLRLLLNDIRSGSQNQKSQLDLWREEANEAIDGESSIPKPIRNALLEQCIQQRLVLLYLRSAKVTPGQSQLDADWEERRQAMLKRGRNLQTELQQARISRSSFLRQLEWKMGWASYLENQLNEERLRRFFELRRRQFDGTRLEVAHIFVPFPKPVDGKDSPRDDAATSLKRQIVEWKQQLDEGKISFERLAQEQSQGTTAQEGGRIGWIEFSGPMGAEFTAAAFDTAVGEVSAPVVTDQGVHLVKVISEQPGKVAFEQCRDQVRVAAIQALWESVVEKQRKNSSVLYHDNLTDH